MEAEPSGAAARRAWRAPQAVDPAPVALAFGGQSWVEACRSNHRTCFLEERTYGTSGTLLEGRLVPPDCAELAQTALRPPVASLRVAALRSARMWPQSPDSCFRRMRSACNVLFLVHLRQRSYSLLISISVASTRRLL